MKVILLALAAPVIGTLGQMLLKYGMGQVGSITRSDFDSPISLASSIFMNRWILMAIPLYIIGFVIWLIVLSKLDLSYAYGFLALTYVLIPLMSWFTFGESIPLMRWIGIGGVCISIIIIGLAR